jgi:hypothetical protein
MSGKIEFEYFSCIKGHVVPRYGTPSYIGVTRVPSGWEWDEEKIVPIPVTECNKFRREYLNAVRRGELKKRTAKDHDAYLKSLEPEKPVEKKKSKEASE